MNISNISFQTKQTALNQNIKHSLPISNNKNLFNNSYDIVCFNAQNKETNKQEPKNVDFSVYSSRFTPSRTTGAIEGKSFSLTTRSSSSTKEIIGFIASKPVEIRMNEGIFKNEMSGKIGENLLYFRMSHGRNYWVMAGRYKDKPVIYKVENSYNGYRVIGEGIDLYVNKTSIINHNMRIIGKYSQDMELLPFIIKQIYFTSSSKKNTYKY